MAEEDNKRFAAGVEVHAPSDDGEPRSRKDNEPIAPRVSGTDDDPQRSPKDDEIIAVSSPGRPATEEDETSSKLGSNRLATDVSEHRQGDRPLLLDGATGTELERRGINAGLPLWSSHALLQDPAAVAEIHRAYAEAGCEWITANTFRTQRRVLESAGLGEQDEGLTRLAVRLARRAAPKGGVLGSAPPLEDCYRPDRVPPDAELWEEHQRHARLLAAAGVDGILVETHNTLREAEAAARAAAETGLPVLVSFVCDRRGRLLSGEPLDAALDRVGVTGPTAVGVNCLPPSAVQACLPALPWGRLPVLISANLGAPQLGPEDSERGTGAPANAPAPRTDEASPAQFAELAESWRNAGAAMVGGCCGTTPAHLAAVARAWNEPG